MAPEVEAGKPHGFQVDVWSLGRIAISLLSETSHFKEPRWFDHVPDNVKTLLMAMVDDDPE